MNEDPKHPNETVNVAARLIEYARENPDAIAVAEPLDYDAQGRRRYRQVTFGELDQDSDRIAQGLLDWGVPRGTRLVLLVRPGVDFISSVFALLKAGMVTVLIDPGMGARRMIDCLAEAQPEGFLALPSVHAVRVLLRHRFPKARYNVTLGRRWFWGGKTIGQFRRRGHQGTVLAPTAGDDPAAIIFTTGSTGPPKGVHYCHRTFERQATEIRDFFDIRPGEVDVPCFPFFGLFNSAIGVTSVIPDMDTSRPATVDPAKIVEAVTDWQATQTFGSPAVWNRVGRYCEAKGIRLETVRRVLSSGAPLAPEVLKRMADHIHPDGDMHTPYGATESLPVASISSREVLHETAEKTRQGYGTCVGHRFGGIDWRVIEIVDGPIRSIEQATPLEPGHIGELIVRGPVVTRGYLNRPEADARSKIADLASNVDPSAAENGMPRFWHRIGDAGYLDEQDRFWFCGRVAHRVLEADGPRFPVPCEAIFNTHPDVFRTALVGVGRPGGQKPVLCVEPLPECFPEGVEAEAAFRDALREIGRQFETTQPIETFLFHRAFPVDIRHNAKIFREKLSVWATKELKKRKRSR